jgi:hypothetical protein
LEEKPFLPSSPPRNKKTFRKAKPAGQGASAAKANTGSPQNRL